LADTPAIRQPHWGRWNVNRCRRTLDLAGPANGKKGFYEWDQNNFGPRVSAA
jgi:hypothetical protein